MKKVLKKLRWLWCGLGLFIAVFVYCWFFLPDDSTIARMLQPEAPVEEPSENLDPLPGWPLISKAQITDGRFYLSSQPVNEQQAATAENSQLSFALLPVANLQSDYLNAIVNGIRWTKQDHTTIFFDNMLKNAGTENSDWLVLAVARYGYSDNYQVYLDRLGEVITEAYASQGMLSRRKVTDYHRIAMTVTALGGDPTKIGTDTSGAPVNLLADGIYHCLNGNLWIEGVTGAAYALLALDCGDYAVPDDARYSRADILQYLLDNELPGGGFAASGTQLNAKTTAIALQALAPYRSDGPRYASIGDQPQIQGMIDRGITALSAAQFNNGSYTEHETANAETTAQVLLALTALGIDPAQDGRFQKEQNTVFHGLYQFYDQNEGYFKESAGATNNMAADISLAALVSYYRLSYGLAPFYNCLGSTPSPPVVDGPITGDLQAFDQEIGSKVDPLKITIADKETVEALFNRYSALSEADKAQLVNGSKLVLAKKILEGLANNVVIKEVFELLMGTEHEYTVSGVIDNTFNYTITFLGKDVATAKNFDARLLFTTEHQAAIEEKAKDAFFLQFPHQGAFPGKAKVSVDVTFNGDYTVYYYDAENEDFQMVEEVQVQSKLLRFTASCGGDYFLTSRANASRINRFAKPMGRGDFVDGVVPKSLFEEIKGQDVNFIIEGETESGYKYRFNFYGKDIVEPMDFNMIISTESEEAEYITQLSEEPLILHFEHEGNMPGKAMLEFETKLEDKASVLFYYDDVAMKAELVQKITIEDSWTKFIIDHCSDYFIADRAKAKSLLDAATAEATASKEELAAAAKKNMFYYSLAAVAVLIMILIIFMVIWNRYQKKKKPHQEGEVCNEDETNHEE